MFPAAGVDDRRPADQQRLAAVLTGPTQLVGDLTDCDPFRLFRGDGTVHELERVMSGHPLFGKHAYAGVTYDDRLPLAHLQHRNTGRRPALGVDRDATVHLLVFHVGPDPLVAHLRPLSGRAVKPFGKGPFNIGFDEPTIAVGLIQSLVAGE
ncbi:MAG: hypothetical protein FJ295_13810 [Planctomycetes bacterium]|nr:hypothetical protein [Planctomycetota bacterium]